MTPLLRTFRWLSAGTHPAPRCQSGADMHRLRLLTSLFPEFPAIDSLRPPPRLCRYDAEAGAVGQNQFALFDLDTRIRVVRDQQVPVEIGIVH